MRFDAMQHIFCRVRVWTPLFQPLMHLNLHQNLRAKPLKSLPLLVLRAC
jgi:hypothetical protein